MKTKTDLVQDALEILIVEDSPTQAEQLRYILEQRHYKVLVANNGKKALALLADHKASLVITDIVMPEMNGYELCKQIKSDDANRDIPVILLTSLSNSEDVLEGLACGADNFITKPYSEDFLFLHVEQILANRKLRKNERVRVGVEIMFGGKRRFVTADQQQMLGLLISTYEAAVLKNRELVQTQNELKLLNEQLEEKVEKRTAALTEEVAVRKKNEEQIENLNRVHSVLSNVNQTIVRVHDTGQLFKDICRIAIEDGRFQSAWIGKVNSGTRELAIVEFAGTSNEYRVGANIDLNDTNQTQTPAAISTRTGENLIWNDVLNDATKVVRRKDGVEFGSGSIAAFPIRVFGELYGVINLSSNEIAFFDEDEVSLLDEMAMDVSFALEFIEKEAERERAEEELKKSEDKFRTIFDNASDGMFVVDLKARRFFMCNATCAKMLGYAQEQFSNLDIADIHPGEDMPFIYEQIGKFSRGEEGIRSDIRFKRKDGSIFASDLSPALVTIAENNYLLIIFRDITERKRAEEALRKSEEQYRTLFEESIDTVFTSTPTGEFTDINPAGVKLFGYSSKEEMLNLRVADDLFWKPSDRERYLAAMATQGFVKDHELEGKTKDGKKLIVLETASAVRDSQGNLVAFRGIMRDITAQKRLEKEFLRAQRMESIGTLAGGVAHDINNVLAPIMMAVEILQKKFSDEESTRILHTLATSAKRGSDIVKQILAFGRGVEGERIVIQPKHVIREIQDIATETFPKSIHIKPNIPNNLWTILSDPTQIHQVLLNICVNARDAMPKGGTLTISSENVMLDEFFAASNREAKPGPYVVVTITDTGTGIPPGILERIFDPFFTTKEIGKGTGLGLSTALGIVKSHGGFIDVHGAPGQGTSFKVYLPAQMKEQEAVIEKELPELPLGNGELILVVDDEASISEIAKLTLEANGYQAVTANDGVEAVTICARDKGTIRLVLMDMNMPVMDGPATIRALRMMKINAKIVATSGASGGDETMMESIPGVRAFLKKPYTAEKLLTTLHDVLNEE